MYTSESRSFKSDAPTLVRCEQMRICLEASICKFQMPVLCGHRIYMYNDGRGVDEAGQSNPIRYPLDKRTGRPQGGWGNVCPAVVVYHDANDEVYQSRSNLTNNKWSSEKTRITHFGGDREIGRGGGACENQRRDGRNTIGKWWGLDDLKVWDPRAVLRRRGWPVLNTNTNGHNKNWKILSVWGENPGRYISRDWLEERMQTNPSHLSKWSSRVCEYWLTKIRWWRQQRQKRQYMFRGLRWRSGW